MTKINQYITLHIGYTEAREKGLNRVAEGLDLDMKALYSTMKRKEQDVVWEKIKPLYPKVSQ